MKKLIFGICLAVVSATAFGFASTNEKNNSKTTCPNTEDCVCCPCTPDCQPGDPNCACPVDCCK